jgi:phosphatidylethanolamine/phosphatidyl-N-methylethanolamine N-methyltransferase
LEEKLMRSDPSYDEYINQWEDHYHSQNYDAGLTSYFLRKSHIWSEQSFDQNDHFSKVLEVGAGTCEHVKYVNHSFDEYLVTDLHPRKNGIQLPSNAKGVGKIQFSKEDANELSFENDSFDRLIAAHVLEHLYRPYEVMREWIRVLKPGGVMTLILPCDPGLLWRLGRYAVARKKCIEAGIEYDYWQAREHVNPINNLVSFVRYFFPEVEENWLPFRFPSIDINLFYIVHIRK